jgi:hypothetical protein
VGNRSPLAVVWRGSRGGSTSSSGVIAGEGDPLGRSAWRVCNLWGYASCGSGPPSSGVCLEGGERGADLALGAACPMAAVLPWMMLSSRAEIGSPDGSEDSWWSVQPDDGGPTSVGSGDKGHQQVYSVWNLWRAVHGSSDPGRRAGDDGGPAPLSIGGEWVWLMIGGGIR